MSLLAPTRGELFDRLSILQLKIQHSTRPSASDWWREERRQIMAVLGITLADTVDAHFQALLVVNQRIWVANEDLACIDKAGKGPYVTPHGLEMFRWNRDRVALIEAIDREAGQFVQHAKVGY